MPRSGILLYATHPPSPSLRERKEGELKIEPFSVQGGSPIIRKMFFDHVC